MFCDYQNFLIVLMRMWCQVISHGINGTGLFVIKSFGLKLFTLRQQTLRNNYQCGRHVGRKGRKRMLD